MERKQSSSLTGKYYTPNRNDFLQNAAALMREQNNLELACSLEREVTSNLLNTDFVVVKESPVCRKTNTVRKGLHSSNKTHIHRQKESSEDLQPTGFTCEICGTLQNPTISKFRIKPKIRKKKINRKKLEHTLNSEVKQKGHLKDKRSKKKRKMSRNNSYVVSTCQRCKYVTKVKCVNKLKVLGDQKSRNLSKKKINIGLGMSKNDFESPKCAPLLLSKSAKKKIRLKNSPLAKMLSEKKLQTSSSPSIHSFLLNI